MKSLPDCLQMFTGMTQRDWRIFTTSWLDYVAAALKRVGQATKSEKQRAPCAFWGYHRDNRDKPADA